MKNILVTGATRGLGLAIAERLADDGYHVIGTGRQPTAAIRALQDRSSAAGRVSFAAVELNEVQQVHEFVREVTNSHGELFGLVNNAAIGHSGVLATMHDSEIEEMIRVNLLAAIYLAKHASRSMLLGGQGRIINVASIVAATGFKGLSVYGATKAALVGFSKSLARELGPAGVTVNTILPGFLQTEMSASLGAEDKARIQRRSALGRLATVNEVAASVSFLLSDEAASITGTELTVDAGSTA